MKEFECVGGVGGWHCAVLPHCRVLASERALAPEYCMYNGRKCKFREVVEPQLPKLTAAVFEREDCPEWAQWAAVNSFGIAYYHEVAPYLVDEYDNCWANLESVRASAIPGVWDAFDWKNSLIERPARTLPGWCQEGAWVWCTHLRNGFARITQISPGGFISYEWAKPIPFSAVGVETGGGFWAKDILEFLKPSRLRTWTLEEAPVFLKLRYKGKVAIARLFRCEREWRYIVDIDGGDGVYLTLTDIAEHGIQLDGQPCGVLEVEK